ncbi:MAG: c-type cytochrome [Flavobacterium sp.]|uniref:c-type cytochrome n=1 Tax=Flavobacterium sp. TaxID=239 RepID=UPI003265A9D9
MKHYFFILFIILFSCKKESEESFGKPTESSTEVKTPEALGKEIFEGKGNCVACHQVDQKIVGPSIQEIATAYKTKNGNIVDFLKNDATPLVDPSQYEVMKTNFAITKAMSDRELKAIEAYIYSN